MTATHFVAAIVAALSAVGIVEAFSAGAGTCVVGENGPAFPTYAIHNGFGQGELDGRYQVKLETSGKDPKTMVLGDEGNIMNVTAKTNYTLSVMAMNVTAGTVFKGFLVTLQQDDKDLGGSFEMSNNDDVQIMLSEGDGASGAPAKCPGAIAGATHAETEEKTSIEFAMNIASTVEDGPVKVTVTIMEEKQMWYFSSYTLNLVGGGETPAMTPAPTPAPSMPPTTAPSVSKGNETMEPTTAPSGGPGVGGVVSTLAAALALTLTWIFV